MVGEIKFASTIHDIEPNTCKACLNQMFCKYREEFEQIQGSFNRDIDNYRVDNALSSKLVDVPYLIVPELKCRYYRERHHISADTRNFEEEK